MGWHLPPGAGLCRHPRSLRCRRELETARGDGLVPAQLGRQLPKRDLFAAPDPNPQPSHPYTGDPEGLARARVKQRHKNAATSPLVERTGPRWSRLKGLFIGFAFVWKLVFLQPLLSGFWDALISDRKSVV